MRLLFGALLVCALCSSVCWAQYEVEGTPTFTVTDGVRSISIPYVPWYFSPHISDLNVSLKLTTPDTGCVDANNVVSLPDAANKAVMMTRGVCSLNARYNSIAAAGGKLYILENFQDDGPAW